MMDLRGREKRGLLNQVSIIMMLCIGLGMGFFGFGLFGTFGAICGLLVGVYVGGLAMTKGRFFR